MGFNCGIVGLPNVGKSTLFNALTQAGIDAENFPFCTILPNTGVVPVPDPRLRQLSDIVNPQKVIPASMEFVDIAGLVAGASKGEGLGNQFLAHIRETQAIAHVVRCFEDDNIIHVDGSVDPVRDIEVIETELALADLAAVEKRRERQVKVARGNDAKAKAEVPVLEKLEAHLENGELVRSCELSDDERLIIRDLHLLTDKPIFYVANVEEDKASEPETSEHYRTLKAHVEARGASVIAISAAIESEVSQLEPEEGMEYLESMGLTEPGLNKVIREGYRLLNLITYLTAGPKEARAWTVKRGSTAPEAAGVIHTDFQRGFIKAEVTHWKDLVDLGSEAAVKSAGKMRMEGKEYIVVDGDVMHFRFNV